MPSGTEFLMNALGIDPEQIQKTIAAVQAEFQNVNERLKRMEDKLDAALASAAANLEQQMVLVEELQRIAAEFSRGVSNGNSDSYKPPSGGAGGGKSGAGRIHSGK
jgi:hypothetical protein